MESQQNQIFRRDRFTWLAYFMLGYYAYLQATLGPAAPFLRDELGISYALTGMHVTAFALGMMLAGITGDWFAIRFGRYAVFWAGTGGMALGGILLTLGTHPIATIGSSFFMGIVGSHLLVMIQAALAEHHGENRAIPLTESNVVASVLAAIAPLAIGFGTQIILGWRFALYVGAIMGILAYLLNFRVQVPGKRKNPEIKEKTPAKPLPKAFWAYWFVVFTGVSIEWSMIFWSADFLENIVGLERATAATLVSIFLGAIIVGRFVGSWLSHSIKSSRLLFGAASAIAIGFPIFWLATIPILNIIGLFIAGLGVANIFPLTLATATNIAPTQTNRASARIASGAGSAILITPQVLGAIADQAGIHAAFGIIIGLIVAVFAALFIAGNLSTAGK